MKRGRRSQAAMEFLLTYGWAILVVLVVIGALAYFGVLDPSQLFPDKCLFGPGIGTCKDHMILGTNEGGIVWTSLVNGLGNRIKTVKMEIVSSNIECTPISIAQISSTSNSIAFELRKDNAESDFIKNIFSPTLFDDTIILIPSEADDQQAYCTLNPNNCKAWGPGEKAEIFSMGCSNLVEGKKQSFGAKITYSYDGSLTHIIEGDISATVQDKLPST